MTLIEKIRHWLKSPDAYRIQLLPAPPPPSLQALMDCHEESQALHRELRGVLAERKDRQRQLYLANKRMNEHPLVARHLVNAGRQADAGALVTQEVLAAAERVHKAEDVVRGLWAREHQLKDRLCKLGKWAEQIVLTGEPCHGE